LVEDEKIGKFITKQLHPAGGPTPWIWPISTYKPRANSETFVEPPNPW